MSYSANNIQQLFKQEYSLPNQPVQLRPGQIVYGKVTKLFPNEMAEIQVGEQKLYAHLSTPLSSGEKYWFQVQVGQEKLALKVLSSVKQPGKEDKGSSTASLLKQLSLSDTKENRAVVASFLKDQLPLTKEILFKASAWLTKSENLPSDIAVIKQMVERELPLTKAVFTSLVQVHSGSSFTDLLHALSNELTTHSIQSNLLEKVISTFHSENFTNWEDSNQIKGKLAEIFHRLGFSYEVEQFTLLKETKKTWQESEQLKPLLLKLLSDDIPQSTKDITSQLIEKITGVQLLSQEAGPMIQMMMQLPVSFGKHTMDATIQYNGKKTKDGKIDSDYCRIMFYLDLEYLKETVIDMHIQNRVMTITIWNNQPLISTLVSAYSKQLKEKMNQADYTLLSIASKPLSENQHNLKNGLSSLEFGNFSYKGVDFKI
ncbi:MAG: hypothetical protein ABF649_01080 [Bacillus sp. (in: firmicutes)]